MVQRRRGWLRPILRICGGALSSMWKQTHSNAQTSHNPRMQRALTQLLLGFACTPLRRLGKGAQPSSACGWLRPCEL